MLCQSRCIPNSDPELAIQSKRFLSPSRFMWAHACRERTSVQTHGADWLHAHKRVRRNGRAARAADLEVGVQGRREAERVGARVAHLRTSRRRVARADRGTGAGVAEERRSTTLVGFEEQQLGEKARATLEAKASKESRSRLE
eukprot:6209077-Pleurochrysis_carterae.AAC.6